MESHLFREEFKGTLFRFPLRTASMAKKSDIKKVPYTIQDVEKLFASLAQDRRIILFLKYISSIELYVIEQGNSQPEMIWQVRTSFSEKDLISRAILPDKLASLTSEQFKAELSSSSLPERVKFEAEVIITTGEEDRREKWLIVSALGEGNAKELVNSEEAELYNLRLVPWTSLAFQLEPERQAEGGLAACFLPFQENTGLPFCVNGYFELSTDRRTILAGGGLQGIGSIKAKWNALLIEELASLFIRMLEFLVEYNKPQLIFDAFPDLSKLDMWRGLAEKIYQKLRLRHLKVMVFKLDSRQ